MANNNTKTPAMILQELTVRRKVAPPIFDIVRQHQGGHINEYEYEVSVLGVIGRAIARNKKEAKQESARDALKLLAECGLFIPNEENPVKFDTPTTSASSINMSESCCTELKPVVNYKGLLFDKCIENNLPGAYFVEISDIGPPHCRQFTYECKLGRFGTARCTASTKKAAQQGSAKEIYERIQDILPQADEPNLPQLMEDDADIDAIKAFRELSVLQKMNLGMKVCDYDKTLSTLMREKECRFEDVKEYFEEPHTMEKMIIFLTRLDLKVNISTLQQTDDSFVICLYVITSFLLTAVGAGKSDEEATQEALNALFDICHNFTAYV